MVPAPRVLLHGGALCKEFPDDGLLLLHVCPVALRRAVRVTHQCKYCNNSNESCRKRVTNVSFSDSITREHVDRHHNWARQRLVAASVRIWRSWVQTPGKSDVRDVDKFCWESRRGRIWYGRGPPTRPHERRVNFVTSFTVRGRDEGRSVVH